MSVNLAIKVLCSTEALPAEYYSYNQRERPHAWCVEQVTANDYCIALRGV